MSEPLPTPDVPRPAAPARSFAEAAGNAIRYWEPRRLAYNGALAAVVVSQVAQGWPLPEAVTGPDMALVLFMLAVVANLCYCAAYLPDVFIQRTDLHDRWLRVRVGLFLIGTAFACAITYFISRGIFRPGVAPA